MLFSHAPLILLVQVAFANQADSFPLRILSTGFGNAVSTGRAIYFITNEESNSVVALPIGPDGTLSRGTVTATGGSGSVALNSDNQPATPDALVSQSALTLAGNVSSPSSK